MKKVLENGLVFTRVCLLLLSTSFFAIGQQTESQTLGDNSLKEHQLRLDEIKVRWKKAALENCPGVPCVTTAVPGAPTAVVATAGNASASVAFLAPTNNGGSTIAGYTVNSSPGGITATGATSPINVTGLTNGTAYTFTVVATNAVGNSVASTVSAAVTPVAPPSGVPDPPTGVVATAGNASASVAFLAPTNNGGSTITGYTVTSSPGGITTTGATSPINVTGLTNGTAYTFTVVATNAVGNSVASAASTAVTPAPPFVCGNPILDIDNNSYNTVLIGTQCWTQENLRVRKYNDGTDIRFDKSGTSSGTSSQTWAGIGLKYGAYTLYAHDSINTPSSLSNYGYLYNWYAAAGITADGGSSTNNICPHGWHVPSDAEWTQLTTHLGGLTGLAIIMKENTLWSPNNGTSTTFNARPGGSRGDDGNFSLRGQAAFFWSSTAFDADMAHRLAIYSNQANVFDDNWFKGFGNSVRCLKD